jgi:hypothetical protein
MVSLSPLATTPAMRLALPAMSARAPTMSARYSADGLCILRLSVRSIESLNVCAVTGWFDGGEKRKPWRIVNVYVLPSCERVGSDCATSGISCEPACPALSG